MSYNAYNIRPLKTEGLPFLPTLSEEPAITYLQLSRLSSICLPQLEHHIWNLDVLAALVVGSNLEDDILLVRRDGLLADRLHQLVQPMTVLAVNPCNRQLGRGPLTANPSAPPASSPGKSWHTADSRPTTPSTRPAPWPQSL